jgi:hypothetical protein
MLRTVTLRNIQNCVRNIETSLHNIQKLNIHNIKKVFRVILRVMLRPMWRVTSKHQGPPPSPLDTTLNITCLQHRRSTSTTSKINVCDIKNC